MFKFLSTIGIKIIDGALYFIDKDYREPFTISQNDDKKFTHVQPVSFKSDFSTASAVFRTVPYSLWILKTKNHELIAADKHLVFLSSGKTSWIQDLTTNHIVKTKTGDERVLLCKPLDITSHCYDIQIDSSDHMYYTNDILSHNTTIVASYILWFAMFNPDKTILIVANKLVTAIEILDRIKFSYECLPDWIRDSTPEYNKTSVKFSNGSKIICRATSKSSANGLSVSLLFVDEFAKIPIRLQTEFWSSVKPTLSTGGSCIITSTPDSDVDVFAQIWKGAENTTDEYGNETEVGINGFKAIKAIWSENPDRDEEWARQEKASMGEEKFLREHCCEFISEDSTLINAMVLARLNHKEPLYTMGSVRWFKEIDPACTYIVSLDPSSGVGRDFAAIQIMEMPSMIQVGEWMHNKTPPKSQLTILLSILKFLASKLQTDDPEIYWSFENNSVGEGILQLILEIGEEKFPGILINEPKIPSLIKKSRRGLHTTNKVKLLACSKLKAYVESDKMVIHSQPLLYQLKNFVAAGMSFQGKPGVNDDLVSSLLVSIRIMLIAADWGAYDENVVREVEEDYDEPLLPIVYSSYY